MRRFLTRSIPLTAALTVAFSLLSPTLPLSAPRSAVAAGFGAGYWAAAPAPDEWEAYVIRQYYAADVEDAPIPPTEDIRTLVPVGPGTSPNVAGAKAEESATEDEETVQAESADRKPYIFDYTVVAGDTLWDIAERYGLNVNTLIGANPNISPSLLKVGQTIRILSVDGAVHEVTAGDTLSAIAAKYKIDVAEIIKANDITDPGSLKVGQELILPGATPLIVRKVSVGGKSVTVTGEYRWPIAGYISSKYGPRWGSFHHGIDIAAPYGRTIVAARAGKVIFAGWRGGYGNAVILSHGDGVTTLYGHASKLLVSYGQWVEAGQAIARVGSTGYSTGNHCHFEVRVNGQSVDPLSVLP